MISDAIQLFDYDDSYVGWITTNIGAVDPHTTYSQGANGERYGGVRDAEPGQVFEISIDATPTSGNYLWFCLSFYDSDMKQLARPTKTSAVGDTHMEMAAMAPANTAYMRPSARFYSDGFLSVETSGGGSIL